MKVRHPYVGLPASRFWKKDPALEDPGLFDPVGRPGFTIASTDPVVTAGSCFAQHVARALSNAGFRHMVSETAHPMVPLGIAAQFSYGMFSARYGNIYTARQLKQLLLRAYGLYEPLANAWPGENGSVVDPFRPQIQPGGFCSPAELASDRKVHFAAIRSAIENMSVFVFTLGLTECWCDTRDGAVFPLAPGVAGGIYDPTTVGFLNLSLAETVADLTFALDFIRKRNAGVRFLLTVSPVPLNATHTEHHVAVATTWSKSVLRLAADEAVRTFVQCDYFPSYEIITSPMTRSRYFEPDCREVTAAGVAHVMQLFLKHYGAGDAPSPAEAPPRTQNPQVAKFVSGMEKAIEVLCDEEAITDR